MRPRYCRSAIRRLPRKYAELFLTQVRLTIRIFPRNYVTWGCFISKKYLFYYHHLTIHTLIINLLIAHSHPVFMVILQNILRSYRGFQIIGKASNAADLLKAATALKPDVIIADIELPGMKDFAALQKLAIHCRYSKVFFHGTTTISPL